MPGTKKQALSPIYTGFGRLNYIGTCLLKNTDHWHTELDSDQMLGRASVDLKKAIGTVGYHILCNKRMLYVVSVDAPPGSCLGTILILIYDLPYTFQGKKSMYVNGIGFCHASNDTLHF